MDRQNDARWMRRCGAGRIDRASQGMRRATRTNFMHIDWLRAAQHEDPPAARHADSVGAMVMTGSQGAANVGDMTRR